MLRYRIAPAWLSLHRLARSVSPPPPGFRALLFHDVPPASRPAFRELVADVVERHGMILPGQAAGILRGRSGGQEPKPKAGRTPCLFTFDDGFASNHDVARDVLAEFGIKALFFVAPGLTELAPALQRAAVAANVFQGRIGADDLLPDQRLMRWDELAALRDDGHEIGCHGMSHRRLAGMSADQMHAEVVEAGDLLDAKLGQTTRWYAFAFGDIDSIDEAAISVIARRYEFCRSGLRGLNFPDMPRWAVCADSIPLDAPISYQHLLVEGALDRYYGGRRGRIRTMQDAGAERNH